MLACTYYLWSELGEGYMVCYITLVIDAVRNTTNVLCLPLVLACVLFMCTHTTQTTAPVVYTIEGRSGVRQQPPQPILFIRICTRHGDVTESENSSPKAHRFTEICVCVCVCVSRFMDNECVCLCVPWYTQIVHIWASNVPARMLYMYIFRDYCVKNRRVHGTNKHVFARGCCARCC